MQAREYADINVMEPIRADKASGFDAVPRSSREVAIAMSVDRAERESRSHMMRHSAELLNDGAVSRKVPELVDENTPPANQGRLKKIAEDPAASDVSSSARAVDA